MPEGLEDGYNSRHFVEIVCGVIIQPAAIAIAIVVVITLISSAVPAYIRLLMRIAINVAPRLWYLSASSLGVQAVEPRSQLLQCLIGHGTQRTQRMVLPNSLLGADVAEHVQLLLVFSAHAFLLSVCTVETRVILGAESDSLLSSHSAVTRFPCYECSRTRPRKAFRTASSQK